MPTLFDVMVIQLELLVACHEQLLLVVTCMLPVPPLALNELKTGEIVKEQLVTPPF